MPRSRHCYITVTLLLRHGHCYVTDISRSRTRSRHCYITVASRTSHSHEHGNGHSYVTVTSRTHHITVTVTVRAHLFLTQRKVGFTVSASSGQRRLTSCCCDSRGGGASFISRHRKMESMLRRSLALASMCRQPYWTLSSRTASRDTRSLAGRSALLPTRITENFCSPVEQPRSPSCKLTASVSFLNFFFLSLLCLVQGLPDLNIIASTIHYLFFSPLFLQSDRKHLYLV